MKISDKELDHKVIRYFLCRANETLFYVVSEKEKSVVLYKIIKPVSL